MKHALSDARLVLTPVMMDPTPARTPVASFDVFDTLSARRCIEPHRIFQLVAERSGRSDFPGARIQAEASIATQPYDLEGVYRALATLLSLTEEEASALKEIEKQIEIENCIPVAENLRHVEDGDLLISDMYLGEACIRSILHKVGLTKTVSLIVTCDGKKSGAVWPMVKEKFEITQHIGDNAHSDVLVPMRFGIPARHVAVTEPNVVEQVFLDVGLRDLAEICREARLATWPSDASLRALQLIQVGMNFPILLLASIVLVRLLKERGTPSVLFSSRDCNLWLPLFQHIARELDLGVQAEYFYTSRLSRTKPSRDYLAYARSKICAGSIVVDICGTGWSLSHLFASLGREDGQVCFLHRLPPVGIYEQHAPTPANARVDALVTDAENQYRHELLEMCNYAEHGMVKDVRMIGGFAAPVFAGDQRPDVIRDAIVLQRASFQTAFQAMCRRGLRETYTLDDASLKALAAALYAGLSNQAILTQVFQAQHFSEDITTLKALGCI